jgi:ribosomal protein S16
MFRLYRVGMKLNGSYQLVVCDDDDDDDDVNLLGDTIDTIKKNRKFN